MFFLFLPVEASPRSSRSTTDRVVAWYQPLPPGPSSSSRRRLSGPVYTARGDDTVGLQLVQPTGRWRRVDLEWRQPVYICPAYICPACWPAARRVLPPAEVAAARQVVPRPSWAQCAVCDPDLVC